MSRPAAELGAELALVVLTCGIAIVGGGRQPEIDAVAALVASAGFALLLLAGLRPAVPRFGWVLAAVCLYELAQLLPLPLHVLRAVAPASAEVLRASLAALDTPPTWHPISLEPGATGWEALKLASVTLTFLLAHNLLLDRARRARLMLVFALAGVVAVLVGFVGIHGAAPADASQGVLRTAFYNGNHAAAFLLLCTTVALAWLARARTREWQILSALAAAWLGAGVCMTLSRGGIVSLGCAAFALALLLTLFARGRRSRVIAAVQAGFALILIFGAVLGYEAIVSEFRPALAGRHWGKLALWPHGWSMVLDNAWVGVGRGAFASSFTRYIAELQLVQHDVTFSHLENQYLHLPAELGLPVGAALIGCGAAAVISWVRRARGDVWSAAGAAGLFGLAVHNALDYNLELITLQLPAAALAGVLSAGAASASEHGPASPSLAPRTRPLRSSLFWGALALALCCCGLWGLVSPPTDAAAELQRQLVHAKGADTAQQLQRTRRLIGEIIARHPADYLPHWTMGRLAARLDRPEALDWYNRAVLLNPANAALRADTARLLRRFGRRRQALIEYHVALARGYSVEALLREALPVCRSDSDLALLLPDNAATQATALRLLLGASRTALASSQLRRALDRWPSSVDLKRVAVELARQQKKPQQAMRAAQALVDADPGPNNVALLARCAVEAGEMARAIETLERATAGGASQPELHFALVSTYLAANRLVEAKALSLRLVDELGDVPTRARAFGLLAEVHQRSGRPHEARWAREQAKRLRRLP